MANFNRALLVIITIFFSGVISFSSVFANPSISGVTGNLTDGAEIVISGGSFGANNSLTPLIQDDLEWGNIGDTLSDNGWINSGGTLSDAQVHNGSLSVNWHFGAAQGTAYWYNNYKNIPGSTELYATYWFYNSNANGRIQKLARFNSDQVYSGKPYLLLQGYSDSNKLYGELDGGDGGYSSTLWDIRLAFAKWYRIEIYLKLSTPEGASNGIAEITAVGVNTVRLTDKITRGAGEVGKLLNTFMIGQSIVSIDSESDVYADDIYVNNTRARVEIGDNQNWDQCAFREIQWKTTSWDNNNITFQVNRGNFATGSNAYLFVVDQAGNVSSGYPVSLLPVPTIKRIVTP